MLRLVQIALPLHRLHRSQGVKRLPHRLREQPTPQMEPRMSRDVAAQISEVSSSANNQAVILVSAQRQNTDHEMVCSWGCYTIQCPDGSQTLAPGEGRAPARSRRGGVARRQCGITYTAGLLVSPVLLSSILPGVWIHSMARCAHAQNGFSWNHGLCINRFDCHCMNLKSTHP